MCTNEIAPMAHNPSSEALTRSDGERYLDLPTLQASTRNQVETKSPSHASPLPFLARPQPLPEITHERGKKFPSITITPASPPPPKATSPQPLPTITHAWKKDIPINHDHAHAPRRHWLRHRRMRHRLQACRKHRPTCPAERQVLSMSKTRSGASSIPT